MKKPSKNSAEYWADLWFAEHRRRVPTITKVTNEYLKAYIKICQETPSLKLSGENSQRVLEYRQLKSRKEF